jgi:hypothetical protein
LTQELKKR